jgi:hypothetical protein
MDSLNEEKRAVVIATGLEIVMSLSAQNSANTGLSPWKG